MVVGFIVSLVWIVGILRKNLIRGAGRQLIIVEKYVRSFFLSMLFRAYIIPLVNIFGFGLSKVVFEDIDMGWNERVFGGALVFSVVLKVRRIILKRRRIRFRYCLLARLICWLILVNFSYP